MFISSPFTAGMPAGQQACQIVDWEPFESAIGLWAARIGEQNGPVRNGDQFGSHSNRRSDYGPPESANKTGPVRNGERNGTHSNRRWDYGPSKSESKTVPDRNPERNGTYSNLRGSAPFRFSN